MSTPKSNRSNQTTLPHHKPGRDPRDPHAFQRGGGKGPGGGRGIRRPATRRPAPGGGQRGAVGGGIVRRGLNTIARKASRPISAPPRRGVAARPRRTIPARRPTPRPAAANRSHIRRTGGDKGPISRPPASGKGPIRRPQAGKGPASRPPGGRRFAPPAGGRGSRPAAQPHAQRPARTKGSPVTLDAVQPSRNVAPEVATAIAALNMAIGNLNEQASMSDVQADVDAMNSTLTQLADTLDDVRDRGYVYGKGLDERVNDVLARWEDVQDRVYGEIETHSQTMYDSIYPLEDQIYSTSSNPSISTIDRLQNTVDKQLEQAERAERQIESMYDEIESDANSLQYELNRIDWMLDQLDEASFKLEEGENPVAAVKAIYDLPGKDDDTEGALFLTNKRLIYEQKEEKATKKMLFFTTEKELVQEVQFNTPVGKIDEVKSKKKGLMGREDHLLVNAPGGKVDESDFHLKGQDSNMWVQLVKSVQNGSIEDDKAAAPGLSIRDISGPVGKSDIVELQTEINELVGRAGMSFVLPAIGEMEAMVGNLGRDLKAARAAGYLFESDLEDKVASLTSQWETVRKSTTDEINTQAEKLSPTMNDMYNRLDKVVASASNPEAVKPDILSLRSMVSTVGAQVEAGEEAVYTKFEAFQQDVEELSGRFAWIDWMMGALAQACFRLYPTEGGVAACDAIYRRDGMEDQTGVLFLTDQRLIFEEHEGDFSVMVEVPVSEIENVEAEDTRDAGKEEEHLITSFSSNAPMQKARFVLLGPTNEEWQILIGRARQGDFVNDRAEEIDPAELERLKNAPTNCSACGAAFTEPLLRGQTEITCQFCFSVTRV